jgi:hypothetical protein
LQLVRGERLRWRETQREQERHGKEAAASGDRIETTDPKRTRKEQCRQLNADRRLHRSSHRETRMAA